MLIPTVPPGFAMATSAQVRYLVIAPLAKRWHGRPTYPNPNPNPNPTPNPNVKPGGRGCHLFACVGQWAPVLTLTLTPTPTATPTQTLTPTPTLTLTLTLTLNPNPKP
eukprot:scaffold71512_cov48-Phaeocystis_antarctica.AAC.1